MPSNAARNAKTEGPIVLGNAPSSGSTLLRVLLSRLPGIATGGELAILDKPALLTASASEYRQNIQRWARRGYPSGFVGPSEVIFTNLSEYSWTRSEALELCDRAANYGEMLQQFFARILRRQQKQRWLEKTPGNVFAFRQIEQVFPHARFVHILRDGRDSVASLARRGHRPFKAVSRWFFATLVGIQYRGRPNYYELKYEDLVRNPTEELKKLCRFLGESFDENILEDQTVSEDQPVPNDRCVSSWRHSERGCVSIASVGRHRGELTAPQRSLFRAVKLSEYGKAMLPRSDSPVADISAVELQALLGYGVDGLSDAPRLDLTGRLSAAKEVLRSQLRVISQYRRCLPNAVILSS